MADLTELQSAETIKIAGSSSTGTETNYAGVDLLGNLNTVDYSTGVLGNPVPLSGSMMGGKDPTGKLQPVALDAQGRLITSDVTTYSSGMSFGDVVTTNPGVVTPIRRTTYTEQTSDAQRSVKSSSVSDASAGTGAKTVRITFQNLACTGPFVENITLNGTTPVNTLATNIAYIEKIEVLTVGSSASNVGTITLNAAVAGGGAVIGTVAIGDNATFWAHHYVPTGKTCSITDFSINTNATPAGNGGLYVLKSTSLSATSGAERQISDFHRTPGGVSTSNRSYTSPIQVIGPARIIAYVNAESSSTVTQRASFDFFET